MTLELKRTTVFGDRPDELIGGAAGESGLDFKGDCYLRADLTGQMSDHLVGDAAGVAADARGIELDGAMETSGNRSGSRPAAGAYAAGDAVIPRSARGPAFTGRPLEAPAGAGTGISDSICRISISGLTNRPISAVRAAIDPARKP